MIPTPEYAIVGRGGPGWRRQRFLRYAGGRSLRKLQATAIWMNASGDYFVTVKRAGGIPKRKRIRLDQRAARRARRRAG
jgi:hypothetical protein